MFLSKHEKIAFARCNSSELQAKKHESSMLQKFLSIFLAQRYGSRQCWNGIPD